MRFAGFFLVSMDWVYENLDNAFEVWNEKVKEIWEILTESPETFRDGAVWNVIETVRDVLTGIGLSLLVLFFLCGINAKLIGPVPVPTPDGTMPSRFQNFRH